MEIRKVVSPKKRQAALVVFSDAMSRDWPMSAQQVQRDWRRMFTSTKTKLFVAVVNERVVGTIVVGWQRQMIHVSGTELRELQQAIKKITGKSFHSVLCMDGFAVSREALGSGVATALYQQALRCARKHQRPYLLTHTANPSPNYSVIGRSWLEIRDWRPLYLRRKCFYDWPQDLQRIWFLHSAN